MTPGTGADKGEAVSFWEAIEAKMAGAGVRSGAIRVMREHYGRLVNRETGYIPEGELEDVGALRNHDGEGAAELSPDRLREVVVIKVNGGLGTTMGLAGPKSLLPVKGGNTFLDIIVRQLCWLRERCGVAVPLLLMNSYRTSAATLAFLQRHYPGESFVERDEVELMQNMVPKIAQETLAPVEWPADRELEWCPPGHGDLYPALMETGWLDRLRARGVKYAFVSSGDNLGAVLDGGLLDEFAASGGAGAPVAGAERLSPRLAAHAAKRGTREPGWLV